ncbi:MAG: hypothetical protein JXQ83_02660, partial [Candidatus Glassbacteria bacterium]|nr:hypothetical protein [Candidatus Glassbacteria bacterium]
YFQGLEQVKATCEKYGVEIIPSIFSVGYGGSVLAHNKNLAAGLPVEDALFVVQGGEARLVADPPVEVANGGFEKYRENRAADFSYAGEPGEVISVDTQIFKEGKSSLRFENFDRYPESAGRLSQLVAVSPGRCYRLSCWLKTEGLDPSKPFSSGNLRLRALGGDGRPLEYMNINAPPTGDWFRVPLAFNSLNNDEVEIVAGAEEGKSGRFWLDGLRVEEVGLVNLLRRPGTPLTVRGEKNGTLYEEGRDYAPVADPELNFRFDHDGPAIKVLPEGRIKQGERLRVSYYHGTYVYDGQVTACMSEPELYEIWRSQVGLIHRHLAPDKYFLALDEIRAGGTCKACTERGMTMGEILGDCITKAVGFIHEVNPKAEVFIWSDMLDPMHNAGGRQGNYYYHVDGTFTGSWELVPKDLVIACWWYKMREQSLKHFSGLGFRTIGAAYYDADDLENPKGWLDALDATPGACGIMYTTWLNKYALLGDFGDLVAAHRKREK